MSAYKLMTSESISVLELHLAGKNLVEFVTQTATLYGTVLQRILYILKIKLQPYLLLQVKGLWG